MRKKYPILTSISKNFKLRTKFLKGEENVKPQKFII